MTATPIIPSTTGKFQKVVAVLQTSDGTDVQTDSTYTQAFENNVNGQPIYIGEALPGSSKGDSVWRIKKFTYSGVYVTDIQWAGGVNTFSKEWDERASYSYS